MRAAIATWATAVGVAAAEPIATGSPGAPVPGRASDWPDYGGDPGGQRYVALDQISPDNVETLELAWSYRTGDVSDGTGRFAATSAFEATPILAHDTLYFCTPFNRVIALDPTTGRERWSYDPKIDLGARYANQLTCRGVTAWSDASSGAPAACRDRIFTATNDHRLIALDAATGAPCGDFGEAGQVDLGADVGPFRWEGEYQVTSPPVVVGHRVIVGSAVSDNARVDAPSGVVRGYDARTGDLVWAWDLAPPGTDRAALRAAGHRYRPATPNVWAPMSVDVERGLVFVPTGNPSPDYYRGHDPALDYYGSSVVALRGSTGEVVWHFQTVHHDLWDYDVPAQPTLTRLQRGDDGVPAVIQATKMGFLFVLHRESGDPLFPVEERPVPQDGGPGETLAPTQPFPLRPPPLVRQRLDPDDAWGLTPLDRGWCRRAIEDLRHDGIYTPPTLGGSLQVPGNGGGANWGGVAVDPGRQILVVNVMELPFQVRLIPRDRLASVRRVNEDWEFGPQEGTPYAMMRRRLTSPIGLPCSPPPWGSLVAVDLDRGEIRWKVPLGTVRDLAPVPIPWRAGVPNIGGPLVTASGLVFIGAAMDDYLRAFDLRNGDEIWRARLPAGGQATPMSYSAGGRQFVVIAAGGHGTAGTRLGDHVLAFALPD